MKITLSKNEMLGRFRLAGGFEHLRSDCTIEATAGVALDALLAEQLRRRYTELLSEGPRELLVVEDMSATAGEASYHSGGTGVVRLPADCARLFEISLEGWERPAAVAPAEALEALLMRGDNAYTAPTAERPSAAMGADGRTVYVHPASGSRKITLARGVRDPGPDKYTLEEAGLSWIFERMKTDFML
ncbi:MAG: hypothetical protein K2M06_03945 [Muribaculaceae bacterium]|nr:hypothetical protein [Muribaculaceae bacterium]